MAESKAKLDMLAQVDKERTMLEEAKNDYEAYIYYIRNKLVDYEEEIAKVTSEEQREADAAADLVADDGGDEEIRDGVPRGGRPDGGHGGEAHAPCEHVVVVLVEGGEARVELGSGLRIAMRDLEIRGAGNLLGDEQSGHIKEIGVELYQQMLEDAVAELNAPTDRGLATALVFAQADALVPPSRSPQYIQTQVLVPLSRGTRTQTADSPLVSHVSISYGRTWVWLESANRRS